MKILYLTTLPSSMSFFVWHIKALLEEGHSVDLACNLELGTVDSRLTELGCRCFCIHFRRSIKGILDRSSIKELQALIELEKYDVINTNMPTSSFIARLACKKYRKNGLKVVYTAHGFHFYKGSPLINWLLIYPIERFLSRFTDYIVTINKEDYALSKKKMHCESFYIPGVGVDTNYYSHGEVDKEYVRKSLNIGAERFVCLSIGELCPRKNHKTIIKAMKYVDKRAILIIAGEGFLRDKLNKLIEKNKLKDRVFLLGFRKDTKQLYRASDVFLLPSLREGLGLVSIEAMASGKPLITSNLNGIMDYMVDSQNGFACNPRKPKMFADRINYLINNQNECAEISKHNVEAAIKFDIEKSVKAIIEIYKEIEKRL